jgi:hypothetical protein
LGSAHEELANSRIAWHPFVENGKLKAAAFIEAALLSVLDLDRDIEVEVADLIAELVELWLDYLLQMKRSLMCLPETLHIRCPIRIRNSSASPEAPAADQKPANVQQLFVRAADPHCSSTSTQSR